VGSDSSLSDFFLSHPVPAKARLMQWELPGYMGAWLTAPCLQLCQSFSNLRHHPFVSCMNTAVPASVRPRADTACSIWLLGWKHVDQKSNFQDPAMKRRGVKMWP